MGFNLFLFANPHYFRFLIFEFLFLGGFDGKTFLAFLVSEKLDAKLSDNLLESAFFIGGLVFFFLLIFH